MKLSDLSLKELWNLFPITFVEYNMDFEKYYNEEKNVLESLLKNYIKRINHIGSTAIKNIKTKPIVDILIEITDLNDYHIIKDILLINNYILMSEDLKNFKISFNKGYTIYGYDNKVFHIHIKKYGDCDELYFRDYLKENFIKAKEYEKLKLKLYKKYNPNRDLYTDGKKKFVDEIVKLAKEKYKNRY